MSENIISLVDYVAYRKRYCDDDNKRLTITELTDFVYNISHYDKVVLGEFIQITPFFEHLIYESEEFYPYDFRVEFKDNPTQHEKAEFWQKMRDADYHVDICYRIINDEIGKKIWLLMDKSDHKAFIKVLQVYMEVLVKEILPQIYKKAILTNKNFEPYYLGYFSFEIIAD